MRKFHVVALVATPCLAALILVVGASVRALVNQPGSKAQYSMPTRSEEAPEPAGPEKLAMPSMPTTPSTASSSVPGPI
jgi:hypothetical protein